MKIIIEQKRCIGCGSCAALCPNDFELDESGLSSVKSGAISADGIAEGEVGSMECVKEAIDACPAQCIKII